MVVCVCGGVRLAGRSLCPGAEYARIAGMPAHKELNATQPPGGGQKSRKAAYPGRQRRHEHVADHQLFGHLAGPRAALSRCRCRCRLDMTARSQHSQRSHTAHGTQHAARSTQQTDTAHIHGTVVTCELSRFRLDITAQVSPRGFGAVADVASVAASTWHTSTA